jgi:starch synthase
VIHSATLSNLSHADAPSIKVLRSDNPRSARIYPTFRERSKVLFVTSEFADFVQAGGLGAVSASLPRALRRFCDIRVLVPGYRQVLARSQDLEVVAHLPGVAEIPPCSIGRLTTADGLVIYVVLCQELFDRDGCPYMGRDGAEFDDNDIRFARLSLAAAEMATQAKDGWRPSSVHLNDWQTALAAGYLAWSGASVPSLLTVHNLAHQGVFEAERMEALAIPTSAFTMQGVEFFGKLSFLKAGMNYAAHLTTVSQTYAQEVTQAEFGCRLDGLLLERALQGRLTGILNGVDDTWDPRQDRQCSYLYDAQRWKGRYADYLRGGFGLTLSRAPLFSIVCRLVHQKGVDLALHVARDIVDLGGQLIVMGRGEPQFEAAFASLASRHRDAVGVRIGFDPEEARAIFAGSDFMLMPSRFEPCGLSQMYAQRFGAIPIAYRTGGLAETIHDGKTGFLFDRFSVQALLDSIRLAFDVYGSYKRMSEMRRAAMALKFDWSDSAQRYSALYRQIETTTKHS